MKESKLMRTEKATFTNMCMIKRGSQVLVQERIKKEWQGIAFPGGHVEPEESFVDSVIREVKEETGLTIENPILCGIKQFTTEATGRYIVLLYQTSTYSGTLQSSNEGEVFWLELEELPKYTLAGDMNEIVKLFLEEKSELYYGKDGQFEIK